MVGFVRDLANMVTLTGLCASFVAVWLVINHRFPEALAFALVAIVLDQIDGQIAQRNGNRSSGMQAFGSHLDCYADFVSKGLFPPIFLLVAIGASPLTFAVALGHLMAIAIRYSYEFVPDAPRSGLSPDYSIVAFSICYLAKPLLAGMFAEVFVLTMVTMGILNLAPITVPKLIGIRNTAFSAFLLGLAGALLLA